MTNPMQIGFFDNIHPMTATIHISENHELLRLAKVIPWPEQIEIAMNCRASKVKEISKKVKSLVRASHLFAKTKEQKQKVGKKLYHTTMELQRLSDLMNILFPQILHFIKTGFVAPKKIIHLQMSELYSIVRGKTGKSVEFGIKWGISRIDGFAQGFVMDKAANVSDKKFCIDSRRKSLA